MKIDAYQAGFSVAHKSLSLGYQKINIKRSTVNIENGKSTQTKEVNLQRNNTEFHDAKVSKKIQASLLKKLQEHGVSVEYNSLQVDYEELNFTIDAIVKAGDKQIDVNVDVNLKRSFVEQQKIVLNGMKDPLVVSLDGSMPQLSSHTFSFDIDSDGENDQISKLAQNNGFLALDKNDNGTIDNGNELFGTQSGDGFKDLKLYDGDKNGWIDENDKIFSKLRIWQKTDNKDTLVTLGEVGIGAIFLGNVQTEFTLKDLGENATLGKIRKSGFALFEDGKAGIVSQVDLAVQSKQKDQNTQIKQMKENLEKFEGLHVYENLGESAKIEKKEETLLDKLQAKIKELEAKLQKAKPKEKPSIQSQIMALKGLMLNYAQLGV